MSHFIDRQQTVLVSVQTVELIGIHLWEFGESGLSVLVGIRVLERRRVTKLGNIQHPVTILILVPEGAYPQSNKLFTGHLLVVIRIHAPEHGRCLFSPDLSVDRGGLNFSRRHPAALDLSLQQCEERRDFLRTRGSEVVRFGRISGQIVELKMYERAFAACLHHLAGNNRMILNGVH